MDLNTVVSKFSSWKIVNNKIIYKISITISSNTYEIQKRYSDFTLLHSLLIEKGLGLLPSLPPKTLFSKNQDSTFIDERMKGLQTYLSTLISRHDVFSTSLFLNFLELPKVELQKLKFRKFIKPELLANISGIKQSVSGFLFEKSNLSDIPFLIVAHQESSTLSRLGRVWSIIEPEETGFIFIWDMSALRTRNTNFSSLLQQNDVFSNAAYSLTTNSTIPSSKFNCVMYSGFPYKCKGIFYNSALDLLCLFSEYGHVELYKDAFLSFENSISGNLKPLQLKDHIQPTKIQLHNSSINFVYTPSYFSDKIKHRFCLSIGNDNSIRLFCLEQMKIISGGNLNKRINNSKLLCCYLENEYGRLGFFGSSSGLVLVLDMISQPPYLITNLSPSLDCKFAVTCIVTGRNLLVIAYSTIIKVFNINMNAKQASLIIHDNQPIKSIDTNFFSDMNIGIVNSLFIQNDEFLFVGGIDVFSMFKLNIEQGNHTFPQLIFSYAVHNGSINNIAVIPNLIINEDLNTSQNLNLVTASEDGNLLFWKIDGMEKIDKTRGRSDQDNDLIREEIHKNESNIVHNNFNFKESNESSDEDLASAFK